MSRRKPIFTTNELNNLLRTPNSCVILKKATIDVLLLPYYLNNVQVGLWNALCKKLKTYDSKLEGILLGFKNVKVDLDNGRFYGRSAEIRYPVSCDCYVFQPAVGDKIEGTVNQISPDHIGCIVHHYFNATIKRPEDEDYEHWNNRTIDFNDKLTFWVKDLDYTGLIPYIEGQLTDKKPRQQEQKVPLANNNELAGKSCHTTSSESGVEDVKVSKKSKKKREAIEFSLMSSTQIPAKQCESVSDSGLDIDFLSPIPVLKKVPTKEKSPDENKRKRQKKDQPEKKKSKEATDTLRLLRLLEEQPIPVSPSSSPKKSNILKRKNEDCTDTLVQKRPKFDVKSKASLGSIDEGINSVACEVPEKKENRAQFNIKPMASLESIDDAINFVACEGSENKSRLGNIVAEATSEISPKNEQKSRKKQKVNVAEAIDTPKTVDKLIAIDFLSPNSALKNLTPKAASPSKNKQKKQKKDENALNKLRQKLLEEQKRSAEPPPPTPCPKSSKLRKNEAAEKTLKSSTKPKASSESIDDVTNLAANSEAEGKDTKELTSLTNTLPQSEIEDNLKKTSAGTLNKRRKVVVKLIASSESMDEAINSVVNSVPDLSAEKTVVRPREKTSLNSIDDEGDFVVKGKENKLKEWKIQLSNTVRIPPKVRAIKKKLFETLPATASPETKPNQDNVKEKAELVSPKKPPIKKKVQQSLASEVAAATTSKTKKTTAKLKSPAKTSSAMQLKGAGEAGAPVLNATQIKSNCASTAKKPRQKKTPNARIAYYLKKIKEISASGGNFELLQNMMKAALENEGGGEERQDTTGCT